MSGNIQWLRWYHGSVTDPKFALVARRSGAALPDVLAVWAYLLERASACSDRGCFGVVDTEAVDCLFGFPPTQTRTADVMVALRDRGLIVDDRIAQWDARQPKREREDPAAAQRQRDKRARDRGQQSAPDAAQGPDGTPPHGPAPEKQAGPTQPAGEGPVVAAGDVGCAPEAGNGEPVTPCHAMSRQRGHREEKKREEIPKTPPSPPPSAGGAFASWWALVPDGPRKVDQQGCWRLWRRMRLDEEADAVVAGMRAAAGSEAWRKDGGAFVPMPRTWLRQRRWLAVTEEQQAQQQAQQAWHETRSGIEGKGVELGLGPWDEQRFSLGQGEHFPAYRARVFRAAGMSPARAVA